MGLFDKKFCDVCNEKIKLLGNRKLADGNMCSNCAKKLSPFSTERRKSTLSEIKEHLAYREANKAEVAAFRVTRSLGGRTKVLIDGGSGKFIVTTSDRWQNENPDVISLTQLNDCRTNVEESRTEIMRKDANGRMVSQFPRQYKVELDYKVHISVNSPFFSDIEFKLNFMKVDSTSMECRDYERQLDDIKQALRDARTAVQTAAAVQTVTVQAAAAQAVAQNGANQNAFPMQTVAPTQTVAPMSPITPTQTAAPMSPITPTQTAAPTTRRACPSCGAVAASSAGKFCESCGCALQ